MMAQRARIRAVVIGLTLLMLAAGNRTALGTTKVSVALQDPSSGNTIPSMRVEATPNKITAGQAVFTVKNESMSLVHELLLVKLPASGALPYDAKTHRVIEDRLVKFVDTDDIQPGHSITKTVTLAPGTYEMLCNQPGHHEQGMHAIFSVMR
jgi:uncharacterized cupredoxin-like copper-binding protein